MVRAAQFARVAAEAEVLRLRSMAKRQATRAVIAVIGLVFLLATLVCAEIAIAMAIALSLGPIYATLILLAGNLVIGIFFLVLASSSKPSETEREALAVRKTAQAQVAQAMAFATLLGPVARLVGGRKLYGLVVAALGAVYLGAKR